MTDNEVIKINKARVIRAVFEETLNALHNNVDYMRNSIFINLLDLNGDGILDEDDTFFIDDGSGISRELCCEEIEELICEKIMTVGNMVEDSLDATSDNMILIFDE